MNDSPFQGLPDNDQLIAQIDSLRELVRARKDLQLKEKQLRLQIQELLESSGLPKIEVITDNGVVTKAALTASRRNLLNKARLIEMIGEDGLEEATDHSTAIRLLVF